MSPFYLGQLRHLYTMMLAGEVTDTADAARGLLGPAIADEERAAKVLADLGPVLDALHDAHTQEWGGPDRHECPRCEDELSLAEPEFERVGWCRVCATEAERAFDAAWTTARAKLGGG